MLLELIAESDEDGMATLEYFCQQMRVRSAVRAYVVEGVRAQTLLEVTDTASLQTSPT